MAQVQINQNQIRLLNSSKVVIEEFDNTKDYNKSVLVIYNNGIYISNEYINAGDFNIDQWSQLTTDSILQTKQDKITSIGEDNLLVAPAEIGGQPGLLPIDTFEPAFEILPKSKGGAGINLENVLNDEHINYILYIDNNTNISSLPYIDNNNLSPSVNNSLKLADTSIQPDVLNTQINEVNSKIEAETSRATQAEQTLSTSLQDEISRAKEAESTLNTKIDSEISRATQAESTLDTKIDSEISRATQAEEDLNAKIEAETNRATSKENELASNLQAEITRATQAEENLNTKIEAEINRATQSEEDLNTKIDNEISRATEAESTLNTKIDNEISRATSKENELASNLQAEINRATQAESTLNTKIESETTRAKEAEENLDTKIDSEISRATQAEQTLDNTTIKKSVVPSVQINSDIIQDNNNIKFSKTTQDTNTGETNEIVETIQVANSTRAGIMSKEAYQQIIQNTTDISEIKGASKRYPVHLGTEPLTQEQYQTAWEQASGNPTGTTPPDGATLVNLDNNHAITYFENAEGDKWIDRGVDTVTLATNNAPGIVKGVNDTSGDISVRSDGTMFVNSWDTLNDTIDNHIADNTRHITSSERNTWNAKQNALNINQLAAVNSGITSEKVEQYDNYTTSKQDTLTTEQLAAVNSGITTAKVSQYDNYNTTKANQSDLTNLTTRVSNNETNISNLNNSKADKATTLSGYNISDAYTKTETDSKLNTKLNITDAESTYATKTELTNHIDDVDNPHNVTKAQVGLSNVDNTADINKPVSAAQSEAITNAVSTHNNDTTAHSNQFSLYRKSSEQDTIDAEINDTITNLELMKANTDYVNNELDKKQNISNLSQTIDTSTDKYPSNNAVKTAIDNIDALPDQTGQDGKVLTTNGTTASWEVIDIPENVVVSDNYVNAKTWKGTKAEYDALGTYDDNITYFITDDYQNITYNDLSNKPQINSIELSGNKTLDELSIQSKLVAGKNITIDGTTISATGGSGLDIGDIIYTTRTDNELSGKVECNGATYNFADVNGGNNNIKALLDANKIAYISIADYESAISSKGWCDKFGYDSGATSFRVPKLTPYIVQKENIPVNLSIDTIAGGTYNVSHTINGNATNLNASTRNASNDVKSTYGDGRGNAYNILSKVTIPDKDINGEASINLSNIALQGRIMVQLFNGATDEALATCTEVLADVAELKDLSNLTETGKENVVSLCVPDYDSGITTGYNKAFTAPTDGLGIWCFRGAYSQIQIRRGNSSASPILVVQSADVNSSSCFAYVLLPLCKNETYYIAFLNTIEQVYENTFYPYKGVSNA